jgi:HEAT repeat protein
MKNGDASKRSEACLAVMYFSDNSSAVKPLLDRLDDGDVGVRAKALYALRHVAIDEGMVPTVVKVVGKKIAVQDKLREHRDTQAVIRLEAAITLKRFVLDIKPALFALGEGARDPSAWDIRNACLSILWRYATDPKNGSDAGICVEYILAALAQETTFYNRLEAIQGLAAVALQNAKGATASPKLQAKVIAALNKYTITRVQGNKPLTIWAYAGLVSLQEGVSSRASLNTLAKFLNKEWPLDVRAQAAQALGFLGKKAEAKVPQLLLLLDEKEPVMVQAGCAALASVGDKSDKVIDALMKILDHKDPATANSAVIALVRLKADTASLIKVLDKMLEKKDLHIGLRMTIEAAIKELKKPAK